MIQHSILNAAAAVGLVIFLGEPSVAQAPPVAPSQSTGQLSCPMGGPGPHAMMDSGKMQAGMMGGQSGTSDWQDMREQMQAMRQQMQAMHQEMVKLRQEMHRTR